MNAQVLFVAYKYIYIDLSYIEEFYEPRISLRSYHTRNSRFNPSPVRLDVERNFTIFQSMKYFNVAPAQLSVTMFAYAFKMNYKKVVLDSYGR